MTIKIEIISPVNVTASADTSVIKEREIEDWVRRLSQIDGLTVNTVESLSVDTVRVLFVGTFQSKVESGVVLDFDTINAISRHADQGVAEIPGFHTELRGKSDGSFVLDIVWDSETIKL